MVIFQIIKKFRKDMITDMNIGTKMPEKVMFSIETEWISFLPLLKNFCHCVPGDLYYLLGLTQEGYKSCLGNIFHPGDSSDPRLENPLLSLKLTNNYPISDNWLTKIKGKIAVLSVRWRRWGWLHQHLVFKKRETTT